MKQFLRLTAVSIALSVTLGAAAIAGPLSSSDQKVLSSVGQALNRSKSVGDRAWPRFTMHSRPIVIYDDGRAAFLINHPSPPAGFTAIESVEGATVHLFEGKHPDLENAQGMTVTLGGKETLFVPYPFLTYDGDTGPQDLIAPLFAGFSRDFVGFAEYEKNSERWSEAYPANNVQNLALSMLENRLLSEALTAKASDLKPLVSQLLAVRTTRQRLLSAETTRYENLAENLEGAIRYTEIRYPALANWVNENQSVAKLKQVLVVPMTAQSIRRERYSASGAAMALVLDRLGQSSWKQAVASGKPLQILLASAVPVPAAAVDKLVATAKSAHRFEALLNTAKVGAVPPSEAYKAFLASKGTKLVVSGLEAVNDDGANELDPRQPNGEWLRIASPTPPLEVNETTLLSNDVESFSYRKGNTLLTVDKKPLLFSGSSPQWPFGTVSFFGSRPQVVLDGKVIKWAPGTYSFTKELRLEGTGLFFKATKGTLSLSAKEARVTVQ